MSDTIVVNGSTYNAATPKAVIDILERYREAGERLRLSLGDAKTGRDWLEESDVEGYVGRSTGSQKVPLLLANSRSTGGGAILADCIVRIKANGKILWQHPKYHVGKMTVRECSVKYPKGILKAEVLVDGEVHARFKTMDQAQRWMKKMS